MYQYRRLRPISIGLFGMNGYLTRVPHVNLHCKEDVKLFYYLRFYFLFIAL